MTKTVETISKLTLKELVFRKYRQGNLSIKDSITGKELKFEAIGFTNCGDVVIINPQCLVTKVETEEDNLISDASMRQGTFRSDILNDDFLRSYNKTVIAANEIMTYLKVNKM